MNGFLQNNDFYIGANYWSAEHSIQMWEKWDEAEVEKDFAALSAQGINTLRMFLVWPVFQPLKAMWANARLYEYRMMPGEQPLPDTEAGRAGVSEEACAHFERFCALADQYGIKLIVGLLTGHMSFRFFAPEAFEGKNFLTDERLLRWEIRFVRYFVKRFQNENAILAWDLGNECNGYRDDSVNADKAYVWMHAIASAIRQSDAAHPIVSGFDNYQPLDDEAFNLRDQAELLDVLTTHPYQIFSGTTHRDPITSIRSCMEATTDTALFADIAQKPCFVEEIGSIGYENCSERSEALFARAGMLSAWAHHCGGYFWWCAFDQGQLDYAPYDWNNLGSDYGLFHADRSPKPVAKAMQSFGTFLKSFPYADLPPYRREAVCIMAKGHSDPKGVANAAFILAKQAGFDLKFAHAEEPLPEAPVYLMPSPASTKPIFLHRLRELLRRVSEGATLYLSTDQLFRSFPALTGLTVEARQAKASRTMMFNGTTFTLSGGMKLIPESIADTCTVLARDEAGDPFFVCNRYGKGKIYFIPWCMEAELAHGTVPFCKDGLPYYKIYEAFAQENRALRSTDPLVLTTEHDIEENKRLVVAINYNSADAPLKADFRPGWRMGKVWYGDPAAIGRNDGCIFVVEKEN